jgi:hypothetical protein
MCSEPYLGTELYLVKKVLPYHSTGNYRHLHHDVMEVWIMSHFGKYDSITFFFKQNCPVSQFLPMWKNFSTKNAQRDKVADMQPTSGALGPWI